MPRIIALEMKSLQKRIQILKSNNLYNDAIKETKLLVKIAWAAFGEDHREFVLSLAYLSDTYRESGDLIKAENLACKALVKAYEIAGERSHLYANCADVLIASQISSGLKSHLPDWQEISTKAETVNYVELFNS